MSRRQHVVAVDWDGVAVPNAWPKKPKELLPGFVRAMQRLSEAGAHLTIYSARLSPYDPRTGLSRPQEDVQAEYDYIRSMLDDAGLTHVDIWVREGKPGAEVYIDDKAERFTGNWGKTTNNVLSRLESARPRFPALPGGVST